MMAKQRNNTCVEWKHGNAIVKQSENIDGVETLGGGKEDDCQRSKLQDLVQCEQESDFEARQAVPDNERRCRRPWLQSKDK